MTGEVNKKRDVFLNENWISVDSKRITINTNRTATNTSEVKGGKFKLNNVWYIFDLETGSIISTGDSWSSCIKRAKDIVRRLF